MNALQFFIFFGLMSAIKAQNYCITPKGEVGLCIPYLKCRYVIDLSYQYFDQSLPPNETLYLRKSKCSADNEQLRLCCIVPSQETTIDNQINEPPEMPSVSIQTNESNMELDPNADFKSQLNFSGFEILNSSRCGELPVDRVAGGTETGIDEYPWMALLRYDSPGDQFKCGGSLITNQFVLTAAHCVNERYGLIGVRLGEHDLNTDEDCVLKGPILDCNPPVEDYGIGEIFQHNYSYRRFTNDIALIKLDRKVEFKKHIKPVCLPITPDAIKPNNDDGYFLAGFGVTEKGVQSNVLLKAHVDHLPLSKCEDRFAISISQRMHLCAGDLVTGRDNCRGDSGGPLMRFSKYKKVKRFIQYGIIVAGGTVCDLCKALPGIYTNVLNYMPWITHKIVL